VKIGSGSREPSTRPRGSTTPEIAPVAWYSLSPDPARYPRAMHSNGTISRRRQRIARPSNSAGTSVADTRWFGTMSLSWPNHHTESWVSSAPLSGIGVGSTTSYTDTRSDATSSRSSPSV